MLKQLLKSVLICVHPWLLIFNLDNNNLNNNIYDTPGEGNAWSKIIQGARKGRPYKYQRSICIRCCAR